jgi:hypothetical protein
MSVDTAIRCACPGCTCTIDEHMRTERDGAIYCCDACAEAHPDGKSCPSPSCHCEATAHHREESDTIRP